MPGSGKEFADKDYWEKFFKIRGDKAFEWYGEYENLCGLIHQYIKPNEKILMVGCGNSKLSESMYDVGKLMNIVNIDLSASVIQQMTLKNKNRKQMSFIKMDMLNMEFDNGDFDVVVDKGTFDALMSDESELVLEQADNFFNEIDRVLKVGGRYMCISLAQDHILGKLVTSFQEKGWIIRIHRIDEHDLDFHLPVFVFIFTKMKMKLLTPIIELKLEYNLDKFVRVPSINETKIKIKEYQNYGLTKFYITNKNVDAQDEVFVHLYDGINEKYPRYTIYILDTPEKLIRSSQMNGVFAAFVVPIGKELEWHFGTKLGRQELVSQAKYQRLVIVYLNRAHTYENLDTILAELSPKIIELAPKGLDTSYKIPMLSMGPDLDLRDVKFKGGSDMSGEFFVEDVSSSDQNGELTRRLVFQSIIPTVQTEVILKKDKKGKALKPNYNFFMEDYFSMILSQLYSIKFKEEKNLDILIIGLGGGALAMYCKTWLPKCKIEAVEIDEEIANCAKNWFGLYEQNDVKIHITDGLEFVRNAAQEGKKWDIVIIDVNSNDPESDLWVPTYDFVETDYLKLCEQILAKPNGIFVLNMICLKESLKETIIDRLSSVWKSIFLNKLDKNRNEVLFCINNSRDEIFSKNPYIGKSRNANTDGNTMLLLQEISDKLRQIKF